MRKFDRAIAIPGTVIHDVDAASLHAGREPLFAWRIADQHQLIATGTRRWDMITVNREGVIISGNHGARAAAEAGVPVEVLVMDFPQPSCGPILDVPVLPS